MGCKLYPQLGENWVWVDSYSGDWTQLDFAFWERKSYVFTREIVAT